MSGLSTTAPLANTTNGLPPDGIPPKLGEIAIAMLICLLHAHLDIRLSHTQKSCAGRRRVDFLAYPCLSAVDASLAGDRAIQVIFAIFEDVRWRVCPNLLSGQSGFKA